MGWGLLCTLAVTLALTPAFAIIPLPYPTDPEGFEAPAPLETFQDPKAIPGLFELFAGGQKREMELPAFGNQRGALGYQGNDTFAVPPELRNRVDFWKRIYTEFTTQQAVIHDSDHPELVYGVVDLSQLSADPTWTYRRKLRAINRVLKQEKKKIVKSLLQLHALQNTPHDIPMGIFPIFKKFEPIKEPDKFLMATQRIRAQVGQRDRIVEGFFYGGRYFHAMMDIFEKKGIPKELTRLPLVESAFNLAARSKVGASGIWQFMRSTGKRYLRIDKFVDERNDPISATWAAAELLRHNYELLKSWPLAITAYNHGAEGMLRAMRELSTEKLPHIIKNYKAKTFGFASANFYSEFLAILEVERDYRKYFGKLMVDSPLRYEEVTVTQEIHLDDLSDACRISRHDLEILNPALTDWVTSGRGLVPTGYSVKVFPGAAASCRSGFRNVSLEIMHLRKA